MGWLPTLLRASCASALLLAFGPFVSPALASPLFELVGSGFGTGGLNARTTGASAASSYFNPALLPQAKPGLEIGWFFLNDAISITLDGRSKAVDIPTSAVDRFGTDYPSIPTDWLNEGCSPDTGACVTEIQPQPRQSDSSSSNTNVYQVLGLVSPIWGERLVLGLYAMVPYGSFTQAHSFFVDEREQFFTNSLHPELYSDRLTPVSLAFGAGSRITDWLSVGITFTLSLKNEADAVAYVGNSAKIPDTLQLSTRVDVAASVSPHFGVLIEPLKELDIGLTLHSPQRMEIDTAFSTYLPNGDLQRAERPAVHSWMPWNVGVGGSYDLITTERNRVAVTSTVTFERWSKYVNRQDERPLRNYEWKDVFTGTVGARYVRDERLATFVDAGYRPSPVPLQTGRTNYVDNDRFSIAGGLSYDVPIPAWEVALRFGGQAQVHILPERHQKKFNPTAAEFRGKKYSQLVVDEWPDSAIDISTGERIPEAQGLQTNNPGWPGFSSSGFLVGGGVSVSLLY